MPDPICQRDMATEEFKASKLITEYTTDISDTICAEITIGKSLAEICRTLDINYKYVFKWLRENKEFEDNYIRAREAQADFHVDEVISIADTEEDPAKARVRIDARKWVAGKMKPKKYGDSTQIKHADADGNKLSWAEVQRQINGRTAGLPSDD